MVMTKILTEQIDPLILGEILGALLLAAGIAVAIAVASYVLAALGMWKMAKATRHKTPWFAWIPFCDLLLAGDLAKQIGSRKINGRTFAWIAIAAAAISTIISSVGSPQLDMEITSLSQVMAMLTATVGTMILSYILSLVSAIMTYILYYKIYQRFSDGKEVLYLVLTILLPVSTCVLLFICGKNAEKKRKMKDRQAQWAAMEAEQQNG